MRLGTLRNILTLLLGTSSLFLASLSSAHHNDDDYDATQDFTLEGNIEAVVWRSPHVHITVKTAEEEIYTVVWLSNNTLSRQGADSRRFAIDSPIIVHGAPNKDSEILEVSLIQEVYLPNLDWGWTSP